jgi:nitroreductase
MPDAVSDVFSVRHSVRDFLPDPVDPALIEKILADGLAAPSWSNTRPYKVAVVTGSVRDEISRELHQHWDALAALRFGSFTDRLFAALSGRALPRSDFRVPLKNPSDLQPRRIALAKKLFGHIGIAREDVARRESEIGKNFSFFGAPVVLFIFARSRMGVYSPLDAGFFAQNLLLSAAHRGLGAVAQGFLAVWSRPVRKHVNIPPGYKLLFGISLGYPSDQPVNDFRPPETRVEDITLSLTPTGSGDTLPVESKEKNR